MTDVREIDVSSAPVSILEPVVGLANRLNAETQPRHKDLTPEEFRMFVGMPGRVRRQFACYDQHGRPVASLSTSYADDGSNPEILRVGIGVAPDHRRRGVATDLLRTAVEHARQLGRRRLASQIFDTAPSSQGFVEAIGGRATLDFHTNVVDVPGLDRELLRRWAGDGPVRAPGYSVQMIEGDWPDQILPGMAHLFHVLERDMPMPEDHQPRRWTAELVRQMANHFKEGTDSLMALAVQDETGTPVGSSHLIRRKKDPSTWMVTNTMVDPDHRGHALGKWLKAAVSLAAIDRWPGAEWMETTNAHTNEPMLAINRAMGFEHEYTMTDVEVEVENVEAYLASRG